MKRSDRVVPRALGAWLLLLGSFSAVGATAATPCPISPYACRATFAEARVKHDFPDRTFLHEMRGSCAETAAGMAGFRNDYCGCMTDTVAATPGEWRAVLLAGLEGRGFGGRNVAALPPALAMQLRQQIHACLAKTVADRPSAAPPMMSAMRPPRIIYANEIFRLVARQVRAVRVRQERHAMARHGGRPVALPIGVSRVEVTVAADGQVTRIRDINSSSMALWHVERTAIREASPFPAPGRELHLRFATIAPMSTPGVNGQ